MKAVEAISITAFQNCNTPVDKQEMKCIWWGIMTAVSFRKRPEMGMSI